MANVIKDMIEEIAFRINEANMEIPFQEPTIRRAMNRLYRKWNTEFLCLEKLYPISAGTFSSSVKYIAKPTGFIAPFKFLDSDGEITELDFMNEGQFNANDTDPTFTIMGDTIYFSNVDADTVLSMWYYSFGLTLVNKEDGVFTAATEINTPEWEDNLHDALFYGTCADLKNDYPMYKADLRSVEEMKALLSRSNFHKQAVTSQVLGGIKVARRISDYGD